MKPKNIIATGLLVITAAILVFTQNVRMSRAADKPSETTTLAAPATAPPAVGNGDKKSAAPVVVEDAAAKLKTTSNRDIYRKLDDLRSENAILTESLKNAELKNKIDDIESPKESKLPDLPPPLPPVLPANNFGKGFFPPAPVMSAQVQMVSGSENKLTAVISLPEGGVVSARVGTDIPNVGIVKSISLNEVTVMNKKQIIVLPFADESSRTR